MDKREQEMGMGRKVLKQVGPLKYRLKGVLKTIHLYQHLAGYKTLANPKPMVRKKP